MDLVVRSQTKAACKRTAWNCGAYCCLVLLAVTARTIFSDAPAANAQPGKTAKSLPTSEIGERGKWGEPAGGLRVRAVAVAAETDEQKPDIAKAAIAKEYPSAKDVTLLVELQNVADKPISLQGTRYGDSVTPPWPGKCASDSFAPYLFDCEVLDKSGKSVDRPTRGMLDADAMMTLSSGSVETIDPGKSLVVLIRPLNWDATLASALGRGDFSMRVRYRGPTEGVIKELQRVWPDKQVSKAWRGNVASAAVSVRITDSQRKSPALVWGDVVDGLQAALELQHPARTPQALRDTETVTFPHGTQMVTRIHVRNAGDKPVSFWSETWRQDDKVVLIDDNDNEKVLGHSWYSGRARVERWTLNPGQSAVLSALSIAVVADREAVADLEHPVGSTIVGKTGKYRLRMDLSFGNWKRESPGGKTIPGDDDWKGNLSTGVATVTVRDRSADDEPPTFTARVRFQTPDGKPVVAGEVAVHRQSGKELSKGELQSGLFEVPRCPFEALRVDVRAPGFEEARFYEVAVKPDVPTPLMLKPAEPLTFRLVTRDKQPVSDADIRYFLRSKADASVGPYPMHGTRGPTWGWSDKKGKVVLDTLQKFDPADNKLGNNIYWFYIEPVGLAPRFIGPVEAGQDLGEIEISPLLEVSGEIHGTPAELAAFTAEWDQPVPMKRGNGEDGWHYAVSMKLDTERDGNVLTFHLSGLGEGKLRIVSRFKSGGKPVSHVYTRREPNEDDVVFEIDLTESRDDLVITTRP